MSVQEKNLSYFSKILNPSHDQEKSRNASSSSSSSKSKVVKQEFALDERSDADATENVSFLTIDALAIVNGDIDTAGDIIVDGVFNGKINARNLKVTKRGQVKGVVRVKMAEISGSIEPEIYCEDTFTIYETGHVRGKIACNQIVMHLGAKFVGSVEELNTVDVKTSGSLFKSKMLSQ